MKLLGLHWLDWFILAVYFIGIMVLGVWSYRRVKNMGDYFMGGRRFGKVFMMFFAFGAGTSSEQAISVVAGTWRAGLAGIWWQFLWLWATPFYWIVAPVMRRMRALTTSDFFEARYDTSTATLYSIFGMIMSIVFIAGGLYGSGKMVNALTDGELDVLAQQLNIYLPEIHWDSETRQLGRGILAHTDLQPREDLDQAVLPAALRQAFEENDASLSEQVRVSVEQAGNSWRIEDLKTGMTYPVQSAGEQLIVYRSGWRLLQGYELAILAMTIMFVTYGMAGGLGAAIITDFIQGILTITFSFLLLPFVFKQIGGFGNLHAHGEIKEGMFDLFAKGEAAERIAAILNQEPITVFYVFMLSLTALAGIVVQPHIMGVCGAGKTEFEGRFGFTFGNFMKRFCTIAWTFTGLACIVWYLTPELSPLPLEERLAITPVVAEAETAPVVDPPGTTVAFDDDRDKAFADELFGRAAKDILPRIAPGLVGLLLASLLAAVMSTSDAQMVVSSGLFTENIYRRFISRNRSQHHYLWVGRFAGLIIVALALVLQATFSDVIEALKVIIKVPAAIGISLWVGIVWRGWTPMAVWVSSLAAMATWGITAAFPADIAKVPLLDFMVRHTESGPKVADAWQMFCYMAAGLLSGLVVSLCTQRTAKEKLDRFFLLLHTPVKPGEDVDTPCTLPDDPPPPAPKLINHPDIELPRPTLLGLGGFVLAWGCVGLIVWLTVWLSQVL